MPVPLLELEDVYARYSQGRHSVQAVAGVSLAIAPGETMALVGESGCGKSTLGRIAIRLQHLTSGSIRFEGDDITRLGEEGLRPFRAKMLMVFQDPMAALNPRQRVHTLLSRPLAVHGVSRAQRRQRAEAVLEQVGLGGEALDRWPHEFSGGQRQRLVIARALLLQPRLLVCDEPVSALDVSVQATVLNLLFDLRVQNKLAYLFISHDLAVVRHVADRVAVMYLGNIVESGRTSALWSTPRHPYTRLLIDAVPGRGRRNAGIDQALGELPPRGLVVSGCSYHPRCPFATELCRRERPALAPTEGAHQGACHHPLPSPENTQ